MTVPTYSRSRLAAILRAGTLPGGSARARAAVSLLSSRLDKLAADVSSGELSRAEGRRAARAELEHARQQLTKHAAELRSQRAALDQRAQRAEESVRARLNRMTAIELRRADRVADEIRAGTRQVDLAAAAEAGRLEEIAASYLASGSNAALLALGAVACGDDLTAIAGAGDLIADLQGTEAATRELEAMATGDEEPWSASSPAAAARANLDAANGGALSEILGQAPPVPPSWPSWLRSVVQLDRAPAPPAPPPPPTSPEDAQAAAQATPQGAA